MRTDVSSAFLLGFLACSGNRDHLLYLIYTVLQADRLYTMVIVQSLLGEVFGKTGQSLLRMFIQMALLGVGAGVGVLAAVLISQTLIFPIVLIYGLMITVAMGAIALLRFDTMEQFV